MVQFLDVSKLYKEMSKSLTCLVLVDSRGKSGARAGFLGRGRTPGAKSYDKKLASFGMNSFALVIAVNPVLWCGGVVREPEKIVQAKVKILAINMNLLGSHS